VVWSWKNTVCTYWDICEDLANNNLGIDHTLEESIRVLFSYLLLKQGSSDDSFSIYPLVHSWARLRLKSEPQKQIEKARGAFEIITSGLSKSNKQSTADWVFEQQVLPYINAVMKHIPSQYLALGTTKIGGEARTLGNIFSKHGRYKQAVELYE